MLLHSTTRARLLLRQAKAAAIQGRADEVVAKRQAYVTLVRAAVHRHRDGPILRFSIRDALLREADSRGVGRFEANLVIAQAMRHECVEPEKPQWKWRSVVGICALMQGAIFGILVFWAGGL